MSDMVEKTASSSPHAPERERSRSPRDPPPAPPPPTAGNPVSRRTCPVCLRVFDSAKAMWGHSWVHRERRDQIYAMDAPAPPPPPPMAIGGGGLAIAVAAPPGGAGWHPWKIDSREERDRTCPRCSKVFGSPKAMFGHLHVHYERATARRPRADANPVQAVAAVLPALPWVDVPVEEMKHGVGDEEEVNSPARSIDLNRPAVAEEEEVVVANVNGDGDSDSPMSIDLNRTPPKSEFGDDSS